MESNTLTVEWVALAELHPNPANPRLNDAAVDPVADSLRRFGWQQPIVAKRTGEVVAGHTRLLAAKQLGMESSWRSRSVIIGDNECQYERFESTQGPRMALRARYLIDPLPGIPSANCSLMRLPSLMRFPSGPQVALQRKWRMAPPIHPASATVTRPRPSA